MALDAATLALCARELGAALTDARIDKIFEPTRDEVVLNMRTRTDNFKLFLSARSGSVRACLTKEVFENPAVPPTFCMLLRKHFTGGRLLDVRTIVDERIIFFDFQCTNEMGDKVVNTIATELMGRYSNLVLVYKENAANPASEGKIIDALKRVDFGDSEVRQLLPGLLYRLPPKPEKASFLSADAQEIVTSLQRKSDLPVADALMRVTGGVGPVVCREVAFRAFGGRDVIICNMTQEEKTVLTDTIVQVQALYAAGGQPTEVRVDGRPVEFSFMPLTQYGNAQMVSYESYSALLEGYYATKDKAERLRQKSRDLSKKVHNLHDRAVRKAAARREEQLQSAASDELRVFGELLSANLWAVERGAPQVTLNNYYDGNDVSIPLDVRLSPSANAQKYFKDYKKKQTAARLLTSLIQQSDAEVLYLKSVCYEVDAAEGEQALGEIRAELKDQGYLKYYKVKDKKQKPADFLRFQSDDDFSIFVGRNNAQNDRLTCKIARGCDWWFHVKNAPGSHVILISEGGEVSDAAKTQAAMLAVRHSSQNGGAKIAVDYTHVRNVWKASGAKPGMVLYETYETAYVTVDEEKLPAPM